MTIARAEDWLKAVCEDALGTGITVTTGPHDWDGSFLKNLLANLPAVVITWDGGTAAASTSLSLDATWTLYVVTGWQGGDQAARRRAATECAWAILTVLGVRLHNTNMGDRQYSAEATGAAVPNIPAIEDLEGFGRLRVADITNEGSGEWDRVGVAIFAAKLAQNIPLELPVDENLPEWLRTNATFDLPGVGQEFDPDQDEIGVDGDLTSRFDMPQT